MPWKEISMNPNCRTDKIAWLSAVFIITACVLFVAGCEEPQEETHVPEALGTVTADDGSVWEQVSEPGFDNDENISVVAMCQYKGRLYAMTRNEDKGAEVWRTDETGWEQVTLWENEKNGVYDNPRINNVWGRMVVFQDRLYVGFSTGVQGTYLYATGCEIWRYDDSTWEPVISDKRDSEESGSIIEIAGCAADDGDLTAAITDDSKSWQTDQWAGAVLQITSGSGRYRKFDIISNTADTLVVQQNEIAGELFEYTICAEQEHTNPFPTYTYSLGEVETGDDYEIGTGWDESGFGDYWNKTITAMRIYDEKLYVSTGLNYDYGAQVWYTPDGDTWQVTQPANSFGNYHDNVNYIEGKKAVSSSITDLVVSSVSGEQVLYAGGTGTSGEKGSCSRLARMTDSGWELIVDASVDENDTGTNENGFDSGMDCTMFDGNFMPWSLADFQDRLYVGINSLGGISVLYSDTGSPEDGSWFYSVGGDSAYPDGFDGRLMDTDDPIFAGTYNNIAPYLYEFDNELYAGIVIMKSEKATTGAHIWKTPDGTNWVKITGNGFGDTDVLAFEAFARFGDTLYVSASKASATSATEGGAIIYRLAAAPETVPETPSPQFMTVASYSTTMSQNGDDIDVYYPVSGGTETFPVALLMQGGRVDKMYYEGYAQTVSQYGFIVIVPNHMITIDMAGFIAEGLFAEQQQMYDTLAFTAQENDNASSPLYGIVDTQRLVMLGHSYGAACTIGAMQNSCEYPFCPEGATFTRPEELKAVALCGINTKPYGPVEGDIRETNNLGMPFAIINGKLDNNATYDVTKISYDLIQDPPKAMVFIKGANHYAMCDMNNPPGPGADPNVPTLEQEVSAETAARWSALFLRAYALDDEDALEYVHTTGQILDPNVEVTTDPGT